MYVDFDIKKMRIWICDNIHKYIHYMKKSEQWNDQ